MFVIKYDKVSMVKLVQSIEKYPAIYDTSANYTRDEQDEAWDNVSREVGEKDILCRDRWHSIKSCYIRHLKYTALNSSRKPYYLSEYLEFLLPYVSDRIKKFISLQNYDVDNLPSYLREALPTGGKQSLSTIIAQRTSNGQETKIKTEEAVEVDEMEQGWLGMVDVASSQQSSSSQTPVKKPKISVSSTSHTTVKPVNQATASDEDVSFFKSLLPDVGRMSSHQKLKFKQETLSIIEDILYAHVDVNITD